MARNGLTPNFCVYPRAPQIFPLPPKEKLAYIQGKNTCHLSRRGDICSLKMTSVIQLICKAH